MLKVSALYLRKNKKKLLFIKKYFLGRCQYQNKKTLFSDAVFSEGFGLVIIPFQNISKNPLEYVTFRQKSFGFCILERETPQPCNATVQCTPQTDISHC